MLSRTRRHAARTTIALVAAAAAVLGLAAAPEAVAGTNQAPYGSLAGVFQVGQGILMTGWAADPDTSAAATVYTMVDSTGRASSTANRYNPAGERQHPGVGTYRGFSSVVSLPAGTHRVCMRIVNYPATTTVLIGCRTVTLAYDPIGTMNTPVQAPGTLTATGWAIDPGSPHKTTRVAIRVDGHGIAGAVADQPYAGLAQKHPLAGGNHGYSITFPVAEGAHQICLKIFNIASGSDTIPACVEQSVSFSPTGAISGMSQIPGGVRLRGWAQDPDSSAAPVVTAIYNGASLGQSTAGGANAAHPQHGFSFDVTFPETTLVPGARRVCLRVRNIGTYGTSRTVQCVTRSFDWNPSGALESATQQGSTALVSGWATDPDTTGPVSVRLTVDGTRVGRVTAGGANGSHPGHMFSTVLTSLSQGTHTVCAAAINTSFGSGDASPNCRKVTLNFNPYGTYESVRRVTGGSSILATGWAIDPKTTEPISVQVSVGSNVTTAVANVPRADVAAAHPGTGTAHGFAVTVPEPDTDGEHRVCVSAVNSDTRAQATVALGCRLINAVHPVVPSAPTGVTAVGGFGGAQITWTAPTSDGGAPLTTYTVHALPSGPSTTVPASVRAATLYGLKPSTRYSFSVQANNVAGASAAGISPTVTTQKQPPPQTSPAPISTSRYIRNIYGSSSTDLAKMRSEGAADARANPSGHGYLILLDIGGQDESRHGVILTAGVRYVSYADMVRCLKAYVDGYASAQRVSAPVTVAIATNNDIDVYRASGVNFANTIIDPVQSYARRYPGVTIAGSDDMEPGFRAGYAQTKSWLQGYLSASTAPFVFTGSADGCSSSYTGRSCNNGWSMAGLYYLAAGAYPLRMFNLPQVYNNTMAQQWRYISLTGVRSGLPKINFGGALTEWTACQQARSCGSLTGNVAWQDMWNALRAEPALRPSSLPYSTDLRIDS